MNPKRDDDIPFSIEFLLDKLKNVDEGNISLTNLRDYKLKKLAQGLAFTSEICQLKFFWKIPTSLDSVLLKIPEYQNLAEDQDIEMGTQFVEHAHGRECDFYRHFENSSIPLKLPKFYYGYPYSRHHKDGLIIMEDLSERSRTIGMVPGFTNEQTESVLTELAKVHAESLLNRNWVETMSIPPEATKDFIELTRTTAQNLKEIRPGMFDKLLEDMDPAYDIKFYEQCAYEGTKNGIPACIVHSDLWAANILWRTDKDGEATSIVEAIIDWQTCFAGNPAADIARLLSFNTPSKYRHENEDRLLKFYYDVVNDAMDKSIPFTLDQLRTAYKVSLPYVATVAGFGAPLYYNMKSVVGSPPDPNIQNELLDRVYNLFKDAVDEINA